MATVKKMPIQLFKTIDGRVIIYCDTQFVEMLQKMKIISLNEINKKDSPQKFGGMKYGATNDSLSNTNDKPLVLDKTKLD